MNILFDVILLAVFAFFVIRGYIRGFVCSLLSFGRTIVAILLTIALGGLFSSWIASVTGWKSAGLISYVLLFVLLFVGMTLVIRLVKRIVELPVLKQLDKLLGTLLGLVTGWINASLLATAIYVAVFLVNSPEIRQSSILFHLSHNLNFFSFLIDKMI